jgi:hypothetical protein
MISWICKRLGHRVRWYGRLGCACHCLCNTGWLATVDEPRVHSSAVVRACVYALGEVEGA